MQIDDRFFGAKNINEIRILFKLKKNLRILDQKAGFPLEEDYYEGATEATVIRLVATSIE